MICPTCRKGETRVIDSREDEQAIRRRRECMACQFRFTTFERIEILNLMVVKRNRTKQPFSKEKLLRGISLAAAGREAVLQHATTLADRIERDLYATGKEEVSSHQIGTMVLDQLKTIDPVAYLRFASVYRSFDDLKAFEKELDQIVKEQGEQEVRSEKLETRRRPSG
ncbi:transcriptional repressor NrdR [Candidatus Berkelbacteria bacterium]|nr:transcriptional repressor NrdR [Candidatus Berkelbacteria bacterium]